MRLVRSVLAFIVAVLVAGILGTALSTQFVIAGLESVDASVPMAERIDMTFFDLMGMGPIYTIVMAIGLLVGFLVATGLLFVIPLPRWVGYALAGGAAVVTMLFFMQQTFWGTMPIAGARTALGYGAQIAAGALGGVVFALIAPGRRKKG